MPRISKSSAIGYAVDSCLENLLEDLEDFESFPLGSEQREDAVRLVRKIIASAPRRYRKYWEAELIRRPIR